MNPTPNRFGYAAAQALVEEGAGLCLRRGIAEAVWSGVHR